MRVGFTSLFVACGILNFHNACNRQSDDEIRKAWKGGSDEARQAVSKSLIKSDRLLGRTEQEVIALLDKPATRGNQDIYRFSSGSSLNLTYSSNDVVVEAMGSGLPAQLIEEAFDLDLWKSGTRDERMRMARSLKTTSFGGPLFGKSRLEVCALLGDPDDHIVVIYYELENLPRDLDPKDRTPWMRDRLMFIIELHFDKVTKTSMHRGS